MGAEASERVRQMARVYYGIELTSGRAAELATEIDRLEATTREGLGTVDFDSEPSAGFRRILLELAHRDPA